MLPAKEQSVSTKLAYSYREAGQALGLSASTIRRLVDSGKIPAVRIGGSVRIPASALEALIGGAK
jgi:excisionase family DNA binding protein